MFEIILFSLPSLFIAKFIDLFLNGAGASEINFWLLLMIGISILQAIVFYTISTINEILAHRVTTDMTADLFESLHSQPLAYFDNIETGDIMARATGDTRIINIGLSPAFRVIGQIFTAYVFAIIVLFYLSPELTLVLIIGLPIFALSLIKFGKNLEPLSKEVQLLFSDLSVNTIQSFHAIRDIKSYNVEKITSNKFDAISEIHADYIKRVGYVAAYYYPGLIITTILALISSIGIYFITIGRLTIPELIAFIALITHIGMISGNLQFVTRFAASSSASARRLMEIINLETVDQLDEGLEFDKSNAKITFQNVSFQYPTGQNMVLKDINLTIENGETIAIVGGPGSGKSTFSKLILRLYPPSEGHVLIGDHDIAAYSNSSLRKNISAIEQDVFLFSDSIRANIGFGKVELDVNELTKVTNLAALDDFIEALPDKFETSVGERGVRLSGGQKQRIAIARALAMDPAILIMDDASSALDSETEQKIQRAIKNVLQTRTSIIVTHRLAIISEADRVIVFDGGRIVANGPHHDLIKSSQVYRNLYEGHYELPPLQLGS